MAVTLAPHSTRAPRAANRPRASAATSASRPGRISGIISKIVTRAPRLEKRVANSTPMTPPPISTALAGKEVSSSASSLVSAPSAPGMGGRAGAEPGARMNRSAVTIRPATSISCAP